MRQLPLTSFADGLYDGTVRVMSVLCQRGLREIALREAVPKEWRFAQPVVHTAVPCMLF